MTQSPRVDEDWSPAAKELQQRVSGARKSLTIAALLPVFAVVVVATLLLPLVFFARTAANEYENAQLASQSVARTIAEAGGDSRDVAGAVVVLAEKLAEAQRRLKNVTPIDSACLRGDIVNACALDTDRPAIVAEYSTARAEISPSVREMIRRDLRCKWPVAPIRFEVDGFADSRPWVNNLSLSTSRAAAVADIVADEYKIARGSIVVRGNGSTVAMLGKSLECQRVAVVSATVE